MLIHKDFKKWDSRLSRMVNIVAEYGPYRFFPTLTFNYPLTDGEGIDTASLLIRRLNKKLLGKHWRSKGIEPLRGIATLERTKLKRNADCGEPRKDRASCHFHFLVRDHDILARDDTAALAEFEAAFGAVARRLNYQRKTQLVGKDGAKVSAVYSEGAHEYVVKDAWKYNWELSKRFFLLAEDGLLVAFDPDEGSSYVHTEIKLGDPFFRRIVPGAVTLRSA